MMFIEREIVRRLAKVLVDATWEKSERSKEQHCIVVDGDQGYDHNAARFPCDSQLVGGGAECTVEAIFVEADKFDECHIFIDGPSENVEEGHGSWIRLIFGNGNSGWDVISDYTTDLEPVLKPVLDWIEKEGTNG